MTIASNGFSQPSRGPAKMLRAWPALFVAALVFVVGFSALTANSGARAVGSCAVPFGEEIDAEEHRLIELINDYRGRKGVQPLQVSSNLNRAAAWMAADMAGKNYFSHIDSVGRNPSTRIADCGYSGYAGENIAAGASRDTAQEVFDAWLPSAVHAANMLDPGNRTVAVGRVYSSSSSYGWYWVADFGRLEDTSPLPIPTSTPAASGSTVQLHPGANLITWLGPDAPPGPALSSVGTSIRIVYTYDGATGSWQRYGPTLPPYANNLRLLRHGQAYWVISDGFGDPRSVVN